MPASRTAEDLRTTFEATRAPRGPLLVATDTSPASDAAFRLADAMSRQTGAAVQVVSAVPPNALPTYGFEAVAYPGLPAEALMADRRTAVVAQLGHSGPDDWDWPITVRVGEPAREIATLARAHEARLVLVGRGKHPLVERLFSGETVLRLLQQGDTPVFAVDAHLERLPQRVVIATDFSVFSIYAAQVALDFVAPHASIELVHVAPRLSDTGAAVKDFVEEYREQAAASFAALLDRIRRPGLSFTTTVLEGHIGNTLVAHLHEQPADVVVTATHGYGFMRRMMLGSVAATLVREAPCSVLCVPGSARTQAAARARQAVQREHTHVWPDDRLAESLDAFTQRQQGRRCSVEVHQYDIGVQPLGHHLPLRGMTWEAPTRSIVLTFGGESTGSSHLTHAIGNVEEIALLTDLHGGDHMLQIKYPAGETLVMLE